MDRLEQFANDLDSDMTMFQDGYEETVKEHFNLDSSSSACWYFADSGMHFYFSPYEIAPYSVGDIDIEIPYEELQGVLKEAYFPQAAPVYGDSFSISAAEEGQIDEAQFAQALSVELDENGTKVAIFPAPPFMTSGWSRGDGMTMANQWQLLRWYLRPTV